MNKIIMLAGKKLLLTLALSMLFCPTVYSIDLTSADLVSTAEATAPENNFKLDIKDKVINEKNYYAATAVSIDETKKSGLNLKVGSAVKASEVTIILHNITGQVYFKGSLANILKRIKNRIRVN